MQLSTPSCPGNLTNHSPHTLEKNTDKEKKQQRASLFYKPYAELMLCYAMLCSSNRSWSQDASALRPPRISDRRSKMNVRRPQEIQHERQEAPAGPQLSARSPAVLDISETIHRIPWKRNTETRRNNRERHSFTNPMLCYAMFMEQKSEPGRKRSAATQNLRQKVQNERQEASGDPT